MTSIITLPKDLKMQIMLGKYWYGSTYYLWVLFSLLHSSVIHDHTHMWTSM